MSQNKVFKLMYRLEHELHNDKERGLIRKLERAGGLPRFLNICASKGYINAIEKVFHLYPDCLDVEDSFGRTPLHSAAAHGHLITLNRLLDWGADARKKTKHGSNLFHSLAKRPLPGADLPLVKVCTARPSHARGIVSEDNCNISGSGSESESDSNSDSDDCRKPNYVLERVYGVKEYIRRSLKSMHQSTEIDENKGTRKGVVDVNNRSWSASSHEIANGTGKLLDCSCNENSKEQKEKGFEEWKREVFEDGALERAEAPSFEELLEHTVRRLSVFCDPNAQNSSGKTPICIALRSGNISVAEALRRLNGQRTQETKFQRITRTITRMAADSRSHQTMCIMALREILDSEPRVPLARLSHEISAGRKYRILSMDGGGVRCIMHPVILRRVLEHFPRFLENTEMFAGCSGAALVSAGLITGLSPSVIGRMTEAITAQTLTKPEGNGITGVRYTTRWLRLMGDLVLGNVQLRDLPRHVVIPSYSLDGGEKGVKRRGDALFMTNAIEDATNSVYLKDACLRSSSAPTYFRCYQSNIDGGLFANNPSGCAIPLVVGAQPSGLGVPPEDVVCLSLGTGFGYKACFEEPSVIEGGFLQWGTALLDILNVAQSDYINRCGRALLGERYFRCQPTLPSYVRLDNVKDVESLKSLAEEYPLEPLFEWIEKYWF